MSDGYRFDLTCPRCGGDVTHCADGRPQGGTFTSCLFACLTCMRQYQIRVHIQLVNTKAMNNDAAGRRHTYKSNTTTQEMTA